MKEIHSVTKYLPDSGERVMAFGYKTFCCKSDMEKEAKWHEVIFTLDIIKYSKKDYIPEDVEESLIKDCTCSDNWTLVDNSNNHLLGVTMWRYL
jgi:hypothetical protein